MWMYRILPQFLNMTLTASLVILFVLVIRLFLRKMPKIFSYALWAVVLFRLLCPVSFSSEFSLLGLLHLPQQETEERWSGIEYVPEDIVHTEYPEVQLPTLTGENTVEDQINEQLPQGEEQLRADPLEAPVVIATYVWWLGILVMFCYSLWSYLRLRRHLADAVPEVAMPLPGEVTDKSRSRIKAPVYRTGRIASPFVMGLLRPRIYLPAGLMEKEETYILFHEQTHIRRGDHVIKLLAFLALSLHWFNPLVWLAFILASRDMEMSCDERAMKELWQLHPGTEQDIRCDYSATLLNLAVGRRIPAITPLAFGEGDTRSRIKNVLNYRKPAFWLILVALVVVVTAGIGLLANPLSDTDEDADADGKVEILEVGSDEPDLIPGRYEFTSEEGMPMAWIELRSDGKFAFVRHIAVSYMPRGDWYVEDGVLHMYVGEQEEYLFDLVYLEEDGETELALRYQGGEMGIVEEATIFRRNPLVPEEDLYYLRREVFFRGKLYKDTGKEIPVEPEESETYDLREELSLASVVVEPHVDAWKHPMDSGQTNFVTEEGTKVAYYEDGIIVLWDQEWVYYEPVGLGETVVMEPEEGAEPIKGNACATLEEAIYSAILDHNQDDEFKGTASWTELLSTEAHWVDGERSQNSFYLAAMYKVFAILDVESGELTELGGSYLPVRVDIVREEDESGNTVFYWQDYWEPESGALYEESIRNTFPSRIWDEALDIQKYEEENAERCYEQAMKAVEE